MKELNNDKRFRFHMAKTATSGKKPLDALAKSDDEWLGWQIYSGEKKERFIKEYIVSFAQISGDRFLFGGVFRIRNRSAEGYDIEYTDFHSEMIGRLVLKFTGDNKRGTSFTPSYIFSNSVIQGIYESKYSGEYFKSFEEIDLDFGSLEVIVKNDLTDWKAALNSVFAIYLITDVKTGRQYVGSAYGEGGIWSRWTSYVYSYHGNNVDLITLFKEKTKTYFQEYFKFAVLEIVPSTKSKYEVINKEKLWKKKLFTRKFGFNRN